MLIKFQGAEYQYEAGGITVKEAIAIKAHTGHGLKTWSSAVDDMDPESIQALFWVIRSRNGQIGEPIESLDFPIVEFLDAYFAAFNEAAKATKRTAPAPKAPTASARSERRASSKPARTA